MKNAFCVLALGSQAPLGPGAAVHMFLSHNTQQGQRPIRTPQVKQEREMLKAGADQDPVVIPEEDIKKEVKAKIKEVEEEIKEVEAKIKKAEAKYSEEDLSKNPLYTAHVNSLASLRSILAIYEARRERLETQAGKNHSPRPHVEGFTNSLLCQFYYIYVCPCDQLTRSDEFKYCQLQALTE